MGREGRVKGNGKLNKSGKMRLTDVLSIHVQDALTAPKSNTWNLESAHLRQSCSAPLPSPFILPRGVRSKWAFRTPRTCRITLLMDVVVRGVGGTTTDTEDAAADGGAPMTMIPGKKTGTE